MTHFETEGIFKLHHTVSYSSLPGIGTVQKNELSPKADSLTVSRPLLILAARLLTFIYMPLISLL